MNKTEKYKKALERLKQIAINYGGYSVGAKGCIKPDLVISVANEALEDEERPPKKYSCPVPDCDGRCELQKRSHSKPDHSTVSTSHDTYSTGYLETPTAWEYIVVKPKKGSKRLDIDLNKLGQEGWELVQAPIVEAEVIFKRPLIEEIKE